ncbi:MAG TPA: hypothetical protein VGF87_01780 [Acidimicrobiales bacterium]|jgi:hypothetical protein
MEVTNMVSRAIAAVDAWLESAERLLHELRVQGISPSNTPEWDPRVEESTVSVATFVDGLKVLLDMLCARPGRWILIGEDANRQYLFWQALAFEDGSLVSEVVSNYYLAKDRRWTSDVRQDAIEPHLDKWLGQVFDPENVEQTCAALAATSQPDKDVETLARGAAQKAITDCDQRLIQYRKLLDEGADPKTVASWMAEVQTDRQGAEQALTNLNPRLRLSEADVRRMIDQVEDGVKMLSDADPEAKSHLYNALGIRLTYDSERNCVTVEAKPGSWGLDRVGGGTRNNAVWALDLVREIGATELWLPAA